MSAHRRAKQVRNDLPGGCRDYREPRMVIASVAPSYVAAFPDYGGVPFPGAP